MITFPWAFSTIYYGIYLNCKNNKNEYDTVVCGGKKSWI